MIYPELKRKTHLNHVVIHPVISSISLEMENDSAIYAFKQLLNYNLIKELHPFPVHFIYQSIFYKLCSLLTSKQQYGEALYYYYIIPFIFREYATQLYARYDITEMKKQLYKQLKLSLSAQQNEPNILFFNKPDDTSTFDLPIQAVYQFHDEKKVFGLSQKSLKTFQLCVINYKDRSNTLRLIKAIKDKTNAIRIVLYCNTIKNAYSESQNPEMANVVDYFIYNQKMFAATIHIALYKYNLLSL